MFHGIIDGKRAIQKKIVYILRVVSILTVGLGIERFSLLASEAILPGTAMSVLEEKGSRQGITERFATQRAYNDIAITYYIPSDYTSLRLFQEWINFMNPLYYKGGVGGGDDVRLTSGYTSGYPNATDSNSFHRFRYPNEYKKTLKKIIYQRFLHSIRRQSEGTNLLQT